MKTLLKIFLFYIFLIISNCSRLEAQSTLWRQIIGDQYNEIGRDVIELRDHGFLMVGEKQVPESGTNFLISQTYLVKLDRSGNIEWQKIIGDSIYGNVSLSVTEDPFGNIYLPFGNLNQAHLMKLSSNGSILWDKDYPNSHIAFFTGISFVDNYKNIMLVGQNDVSTFHSSSLTKLDSSGNLIWTKAYYDTIPSLSRYSSYSNCYLFADDFYFLCGNKGINGFVIKTDTSGNRIWTQRYTQSQYIMSIQKNSENTFIATGLGRNYETYCLKFDGNGDTIWTKNYGVYFGYSKIVRTYNGNFAIGTIAGNNNTRIGIIDSSGNVISIYSNIYPYNVFIEQENINSTSDSGLVLTGSYGIFSSRFSTNTIITDVIIFKVDKSGNMVSIKKDNEIIADNFEINTFPNPFNLSFKLNFNLTRASEVKVELYDLSGKKIREIEKESLNTGNHQYLINTPELSSGIYFIILNINSKIYSKKVLLIK